MSLKPVKRAAEFAEILRIIHAGRARAFEAINVALIDTYWAVGAHLSRKVSEAGWGKGIVQELATWLAAQVPDLKGFSSSNLWRMKQFYEVYQNDENLAPLVRQLSWTHNLIILGQSKQPEEREFYLRLAVRAKWSKRELQRQIESAAFERTVLSDLKLAPVVRVLPQDATGIFKDSYLLDFLDLPERHKEADLQSALLRNLRKFLMEQWPGASLAYRAAKLGWLAANLFFNPVECSNADHRLSGSGRSMNYVDVVEFTPGVSPTGDLVDGAVAIEMMET